MKKKHYAILILSILLFSVNSCVIESYEKPTKTRSGLPHASYVVKDMMKSLLIFDISQKVDIWNNSDDTTKYMIEDTYFGGIKVRPYGDSIIVDSKYIFKSISDGKKWIVRDGGINSGDYVIEFDSKNFDIQYIGEENVTKKFTVQIDTTNKECKYSITGSASVINIETGKYIDGYIAHKIKYEIKFPIMFNIKGRRIFDVWNSRPNESYRSDHVYIIGGSVYLKVTIDDVEYDVGVIFDRDNFKITIDNITDVYDYHNLFI